MFSFLSASGHGRSRRPRPHSSPSIIALLGGRGHLCARFSLCPIGNGGGKLGGGGGGRMGGEETSDAGSEDQASVKEVIIPIEAERGRSICKDNGDADKIDMLSRMVNIFSEMGLNQEKMANTIVRTLADTSPTEKSDENKIKGLLNFISSFAGTLFLLDISLVTFSVTYPGSQKALIHNRVVWPVGIAVFFLALFTSVAYIERQRPTILSKWAKGIWKKIMGSFQKTQEQPDPEVSTGANPIFRPNF
ncbi:unnamed protein product [Urochloa humidicola]